MIPKVIHYCWFGGKPLTKLAMKCIKSWEKYCPDFKIVRWDETNYDITKNKYMHQAYQNNKWGFVPDYARLDIIYNNGGIYLDTDVEIIKPLDTLLDNKCYVGKETLNTIALGLGFGAEKGHKVIQELMEQYDEISFVNEDGSLNLTPSPIIQTEYFKKNGLFDEDKQKEVGCRIYDKDFFNPFDFDTRGYTITKNTYSIHHYAASWESGINRLRGKIYRLIYVVFGEKIAFWLRDIFGKKDK